MDSIDKRARRCLWSLLPDVVLRNGHRGRRLLLLGHLSVGVLHGNRVVDGLSNTSGLLLVWVLIRGVLRLALHHGLLALHHGLLALHHRLLVRNTWLLVDHSWLLVLSSDDGGSVVVGMRGIVCGSSVVHLS